MSPYLYWKACCLVILTPYLRLLRINVVHHFSFLLTFIMPSKGMVTLSIVPLKKKNSLIWLCRVLIVACRIFLVVGCDLLVAACGTWFPDQGSNPGPLHWECGVLATGPPRKALQQQFHFIYWLINFALLFWFSLWKSNFFFFFLRKGMMFYLFVYHQDQLWL